MGRTLVLRDDSGEHSARIDEQGRVHIDDAIVSTSSIAPGELRVGDDPPRKAWVASAGDVRWVYLDGEVFEIQLSRPGTRRRPRSASGSLSSPMPATVVRVDVAEGDAVQRGETLIILEAMKMELPIRASSDGVVKAIRCRPGELVQAGVPLLDIE